MPSYGSLHSPSLRKMNGQMDMNGRRTSGMRSMSMDNIIGDPFALATISISVVCGILPLSPIFPGSTLFAILRAIYFH
jgi:SHO1 osmosensor